MKRLVLLCVSVTLLLSCFVVNGNKKGLQIGTGIGLGEKIESPEDFLSLLDFLSGGKIFEEIEKIDNTPSVMRLSSNTDSIPENVLDEASESSSETSFEIVTDSFTDESETEETEADKKKKFQSATISIETNLDSQAKKSGVSVLDQKLSRSLVMYVSEDATFYRSKGQTYIYQVVEKQKMWDGRLIKYTEYNHTSGIFDMDILKTNSSCYMYFREFSFSTDDMSIQIRGEYRGKWIEMSEDAVDQMVSIDSENRDVLTGLGALIYIIIKYEAFDEGDKTIQLDENDINRLYKKIADTESNPINDGKAIFKLDFTSPNTPMVSSTSDIYKSANDVEQNIRKSEMIVFSNINNTEISFNESCVEICIENEDEYEKVFLINEVEKDE